LVFAQNFLNPLGRSVFSPPPPPPPLSLSLAIRWVVVLVAIAFFSALTFTDEPEK